MVARQKSLRKRPLSDPTHRILDELSHYKQAKTEVKTEEKPSGSGAEFEDLEKDISPFGKNADFTFGMDLASLQSP